MDPTKSEMVVSHRRVPHRGTEDQSVQGVAAFGRGTAAIVACIPPPTEKYSLLPKARTGTIRDDGGIFAPCCAMTGTLSCPPVDFYAEIGD